MYLVTFDGLTDEEYNGEDISALGIYNSKELANAAIKEAKEKYPELENRFTISELSINETLEIKENGRGQYTSINLGYYIE